jgi:hypothetical protein
MHSLTLHEPNFKHMVKTVKSGTVSSLTYLVGDSSDLQNSN